MWFKKRIQNKVYRLYLNSVPILNIAMRLDIGVEDINEIIDFMNEIYA